MPIDLPAVPRNGDYGESLRKAPARKVPLGRPTTGATGPRPGVVPQANMQMRRPGTAATAIPATGQYVPGHTIPPIPGYAPSPSLPPLSGNVPAPATGFQSHPLNGMMPGPTAMRASPQQMGPDAAMIGGTNAGAGQLPYGNHGFAPPPAQSSAAAHLPGPMPGSQLLPMVPGMNAAPAPIPLAPPGNTFQAGQGRELLQQPSPTGPVYGPVAGVPLNESVRGLIRQRFSPAANPAEQRAREDVRNFGPHGVGGIGYGGGLSQGTVAEIRNDVAASKRQQMLNGLSASDKKQLALEKLLAERSQPQSPAGIPKPLTRVGPEGEQLYLPNKQEGVRPRFVEGQTTAYGSQVVRTPTGGLALIGSKLAKSENKTPEGLAETQRQSLKNQQARDIAFAETKAGINAKTRAQENADALILRNARLHGLKPETTPAVKDAMDRKLAREAGFGGSPGGFNKMIEEGNKFANSEHGKRVVDIYTKGGVHELAKHFNAVEQHMDKDELKRFQNWMLTDPKFSKDTSTAAQTIRDTVAKRIGGAKAVAAKVPTAPPTNAVASFQQSVLRGGKPVGEGTEQPLYPGRFGGY